LFPGPQACLLLFTALVALAGCTPDQGGGRLVGELVSDRIELVAEFSEPITEIAVAEGEEVEAGQLLLQLDARHARVRLAEAEAAEGVASARLAELLRGPRSEAIAEARAKLAGAEDDRSFREREYERLQALHERQLSSREALDRAFAERAAARSQSSALRARLEELLAGTTVEELEQAQQSLAQARAQREAAELDLSRHSLRAPVAGRMDSRLFEVGERPAAGQPVLVLLGGAQPHARVFIPEALRARVQPGSAARLYVDGLAQPLAGRVRWVSSEAAFTPYYALTERDRGRLSYRAKIDIAEARERLPDGVPVEVELLPGSGE